MLFNRSPWHAVADTPLAALAEALVRGDGLHDRLVELGWSTPDHPAALTDCGFDNQNGWHWLDVAVDPAVRPAWLDPTKQHEIRTALDTRLVYFKPQADSFRVWWKSPTNRGIHPVRKPRR